MNNTTKHAYLITAKKTNGRKVFEFVQYHANVRDALATSLDLLVVVDARELTSAEAADRNVPATS